MNADVALYVHSAPSFIGKIESETETISYNLWGALYDSSPDDIYDHADWESYVAKTEMNNKSSKAFPGFME